VHTLPDSVVAFVNQPSFLSVAVADDQNRPWLFRASGLELPGGLRARMVVADGFDRPIEKVLAQFPAGRRVAVVIGAPVRPQSFQLKGTIVSARAATAEDVDRVHRHLAELGDLAEAETGVPSSLYRALRVTVAATVEIEVAECFDQTPGAGAGRRIE
jgi:hypothetical protein